MSGNTDFYNSLPDAIKMQITDAKLGAAMRTAAGLPLLPGMTLPDWYASAGSGVNNGAYTPPTYNAPTYGAPEPWQDTSGDVMDYFDDAGYKFRLGEGQRAIDTSRAASAAGSGRGGLSRGGMGEAWRAVRELYGPLGAPQYKEYAGLVHESGLKLLRLVNSAQFRHANGGSVSTNSGNTAGQISPKKPKCPDPTKGCPAEQVIAK